MLAATVQAEPPGKAIKRRRVVAYDATHHERLHGVAIGTAHADDALAHEARALIVVAFVATLGAPVSLPLRHGYLLSTSMTCVATSLAHPASRPAFMRTYSLSGFLVVKTS